MTAFPLFADAWHRRDHDALVEKHWRALIWQNQQQRLRRATPNTDDIPPLLREVLRRA